MKKTGLFQLILFISFLFCLPSTLQAQKGKSTALEALGGSGGLLMYNTYVAIGAIADGFVEDAYTKETVVQLMDEQVSGIGVVVKQYEELLESGFLSDDEDSVYLAGINQCLRLLISQAEALKAYAISDTDTNADVFQETRKKAWAKIAELLGFENTEGN